MGILFNLVTSFALAVLSSLMAAPSFASATGTFKKRLLRKVEIGYNDGGTTPAIAYFETNAKGIQLSPDAQELITQGTTQKYRDRDILNYAITLDQDVYAEFLNAIAQAKATTPLTGASATYEETGIMPGTNFEVRLTYDMIKLADGSKRTEQHRFIKCTVQSSEPSQSSQAEQVVTQQTVFQAQRSLTDLVGATVATTPEATAVGGVFRVINVLS